MAFHQTLHKLGFSPIESTVYITLCEHGALTGYEVAKLCGVSRSNVYAALYSLQDKGKCQVSEGEVTKYVAITKEELLLSSRREMEQTLQEIESLYPKSLETHEPYVTIRGYDNVLSQLKNSILLCQSHLYLLCQASFVELLKKELNETATHCRITIISDKKTELDSNITFFQKQKSPQGFHLILDTKAVLTGDLDPAQCLLSKHESLVRLMRESFITELDMIKLNAH